MDVLVVILMCLGFLLLISLLCILGIFLCIGISKIRDKLIDYLPFLVCFSFLFVLMHDFAVALGWIEPFMNFTLLG